MMLADVADGNRRITEIAKEVTKTGTRILDSLISTAIARLYE